MLPGKGLSASLQNKCWYSWNTASKEDACTQLDLLIAKFNPLSTLFLFASKGRRGKDNPPKTPNQAKKITMGEIETCLVDSHTGEVLQVYSWVMIFWWIVFLVSCQSNWVLFPPETFSKQKIEDLVCLFGTSRNLEQKGKWLLLHEWFVLHGVESLSLCNTVFCNTV